MAQPRIARTWSDVPEAIRTDVRAAAEGDLRRVELVDNPDGDGYAVHVHPEPIRLDAVSSLAELESQSPASDLAEVLRRTRPIHLADAGEKDEPE